MKYLLALFLMLTATAAWAEHTSTLEYRRTILDDESDEEDRKAASDQPPIVITSTHTTSNGKEVPARRHIEKTTVKEINGEIQIEYISGKHSEVVIMSKAKAADLIQGLADALGVVFTSGTAYDDAKPAAR